MWFAFNLMLDWRTMTVTVHLAPWSEGHSLSVQRYDFYLHAILFLYPIQTLPPRQTCFSPYWSSPQIYLKIYHRTHDDQPLGSIFFKIYRQYFPDRRWPTCRCTLSTHISRYTINICQILTSAWPSFPTGILPQIILIFKSGFLGHIIKKCLE